MDNAATNTILAQTLSLLLMQRYGIHFSPEDRQICCLAHIVNLVIQKILASLTGDDDPDDPDKPNDYYLLHKNVPFNYTVADDDELKELESAETVTNEEKITAENATKDQDKPVDITKLTNPVAKVSTVMYLLSVTVHC